MMATFPPVLSRRTITLSAPTLLGRLGLHMVRGPLTVNLPFGAAVLMTYFWRRTTVQAVLPRDGMLIELPLSGGPASVRVLRP